MVRFSASRLACQMLSSGVGMVQYPTLAREPRSLTTTSEPALYYSTVVADRTICPFNEGVRAPSDRDRHYSSTLCLFLLEPDCFPTNRRSAGRATSWGAVW